LKERLVTPELIDTFVQEFQAEYARLQAERVSSVGHLAKKLKEIDRKLKAMTAAVEDGFYHPDMKNRLAELIADKTALLSQMTPDIGNESIIVHPRLRELYTRKIERLESILGGENAESAHEMIRSMIEKVIVAPSSGPGDYSAVLYGELATILAVSEEATNAPLSGKATPRHACARESTLSGCGNRI
jgi:site-specific DNA recombinase